MKKNDVIGVVAIAALLFVAGGMFLIAPVFDNAKDNEKSENGSAPEYSEITVLEKGGVISTGNGHASIDVNLASGGMDFSSTGAGMKVLKNFYPAAIIDGEFVSGADSEKISWNVSSMSDNLGTGEDVAVTYKIKPGLSLVEHIKCYEDADHVVLELSILNTASNALRINGLIPIWLDPAAGGSTGFTLAEGSLLALVNGYQAWDYSGVVRIAATALDQGYSSNDYGFNLSDCSSWWVQTLYDETTGIGVTAGALSSNIWKTKLDYTFTTEFSGLWSVSCGGNGEELTLLPDEELSSEEIYLASSRTPINDLAAYGKLAALRNDARTVFDAPIGWCSWYYYFDKISESEVIANAKALATLNNVDYEYIQIDDGWQGLWGDWTANEKFPSGMNGTADKIHELGFKAGLWLAPFLMNPTLPIVSEHPDWFLKDNAGNYLTYTADDGSAHLCFDLSHPGVQQWIRELFEKVRGWGYDYIKIDFLFAGAYEGAHYNESYTGMMSLRKGLEIIRGAMGEESYIDGCGCPVLPGVGIFDGNRIGGDICFGAADAVYRTGVDLSSVSDEQGLMNWPQLVWECRNVAARFFMGGTWYHNDPDVIIVRPPYTSDEAKVLATACVMSGGVTMLSDKLYVLDDERTAMVNDAEIYGLVQGISAVPLDLFDHADPCIPGATILGTGYHLTIDQLPQVWHMRINDNTSAIALFNWGNAPDVVTLDLTRIGHSGATYEIYDMWTKDDLGDCAGSYSVPLAPHAVQLIKITKSG